MVPSSKRVAPVSCVPTGAFDAQLRKLNRLPRCTTARHHSTRPINN